MPALNSKYIEELKDYLKSGELEEDFKWSAEERREEIFGNPEGAVDES